MATTATVTLPDGVTGILALPSGAGPYPGVLVLHEAFGLNADIERITARFADNGYVALAPDVFGRGWRPRCLISTFRDLKRGHGPAFDRVDTAGSWLADRGDVDADRVGVVGFCMGGGFALLHAARADIAVVAAYYGDVPKSAEPLRGIPPCFGGYGAEDKLFAPQGVRLRSHLDELGVPSDVRVLPGVGHSYMNDVDSRLARLGSKGPMKVAYDPTAAEDSWERMLAWFAEHLR